MNTGEEVDYDKEKTTLQLDDAVEHSKWKMLSGTANKSLVVIMTKDKVKTTFPSIKYVFLLERHSALQAAVILAPTIIMILINLIVLFIDPDQSERILLSGFNAITHFLFLQQLYWALPRNGDTVPNVCKFIEIKPIEKLP